MWICLKSTLSVISVCFLQLMFLLVMSSMFPTRGWDWECVSTYATFEYSHQSCELNDLLSEFDYIFPRNRVKLIWLNTILSWPLVLLRANQLLIGSVKMCCFHTTFSFVGGDMLWDVSSHRYIVYFFVVFAPPCICPQTRPLVLRSVQRDWQPKAVRSLQVTASGL